MVEVLVTEEFKVWYESLSMDAQESVFRSVTLLEELGTSLGFPYCSGIQGARHPLRELRIQHRRRPLRVFYAFDPERQAVLLLGGDKGGSPRFYEEHLPRAEAIWERYLRERESERPRE